MTEPRSVALPEVPIKSSFSAALVCGLRAASARKVFQLLVALGKEFRKGIRDCTILHCHIGHFLYPGHRRDELCKLRIKSNTSGGVPHSKVSGKVRPGVFTGARLTGTKLACQGDIGEAKVKTTLSTLSSSSATLPVNTTPSSIRDRRLETVMLALPRYARVPRSALMALKWKV